MAKSSTIQIWTAITDEKLKVNKPHITSSENAKLKDKDLGKDRNIQSNVEYPY